MKKNKFVKVSLAVLAVLILLEIGYLLLPSFKTKQADISDEQKLKSCQNITNLGLKTQCEEEAINIILALKGTDAAFEAVVKLSEQNPNFRASCHSFAHEIGQFAYQLFKNKKDFEISPKITICNYGFYHGFMEALVQQTGNFQEARDFCAVINTQLEKHGLYLTGECYHGIGHGTVDQHSAEQWSDPEKVVNTSIELCKKVASNDKQLVDCSSGVFNGVANLYSSGQYGLITNKDDLFWICRKQDERIQKTCYGFMARTLLKMTNSNLAQAIDLASRTAPTNYLENIIANITVLPSNVSEEELVNLCRSLDEKTEIACLKGYTISLLQSGQPGKEYRDPINFCESELLTPEERNMCFENILPQLKNYYPQDKLEEICNGVDSQYRNLCQ